MNTNKQTDNNNDDGFNIETLNNNINTFKDIITVPQIVNSYFTNIPNNKNTNNNNYISVSITLNQTDIKNKKNRIYTLDKTILDNDKIISSQFLKESASSFHSVSPKYNRLLTINPATSNEIYFDIYNNDQSLITSIRSSNQIKKLLIDEMFGTVSWSPCEEYLVFVGEPLKNYNSLSFFNNNNSYSNSDNNSYMENINLNETPSIGDQFLYRENWGEGYTTICSPTLFIIDIKKESVYSIDGLPTENISPAQPIWTPCGTGIVFVGWKCEDRKLGLKLCFNRKSSIYQIDFKVFSNNKNQLLNNHIYQKHHKHHHQEKNQEQDQVEVHSNFENIIINKSIFIEDLINKEGSYRSPRFSPDGNSLIFLGFDEVIFNHNSCCNIFKIQWDKRIQQKLTIVELILIYRNFSDEFTGVYCSSLPLASFISNDQIIFSDNVRSIRRIVSFNINTKQVSIVKTNGITDSKDNQKNHYIYQVDHYEKVALCKVSSPNEPPSIYLLKFNKECNEIIKSILIYKPVLNNHQMKLLSSYNYSIHNVPTLLNAQTLKSFEMIYLKNITNNEKKPTIIFVHGGFQMSMDLEYSFNLAFFASLGYNIIIPNYRGSTGFGRDFLNSLVGNISQMDVDDCIQSLSFSCEKVDPNGIDSNRLIAMGGSHGGSICAILSAMSSVNIKTAILRNPVIDQSAQAMVTDINDWSMFKCGILPNETTNKYSLPPTLRQIEIMKNLSPIRYIDNIKVPILLFLGDSDKRVPPATQGLVLFNNLKERNIITKCIMYPNNGHSLDSMDSRLDQYINAANWLNKYS